MTKKDSGVALITVLVITVVAGVLLAVGTVWVVSGIRGNATTTQRNDLVQLADGVSDQARIQLVYRFQTTNKNIRNFLQELSSEKDSVQTIDLGNGNTAAWAIKRVSEKKERYGWVDVHATVKRGENVQTVIRRISFGNNKVFNLAMLAENTDCMYCHLRVNGDVGSLGFLRPGWGHEGKDGQGSGGSEGGSVVNGDLYVAADKNDAEATNISKDKYSESGNQTVINGAVFKGQVTTRYKGEVLPDDTDGDKIPDFPAIDREEAKDNANGTLSGGSTLWGVAKGSTVAQKNDLTSVTGVYDGNLVLIGTDKKPIKLDGDIYATGDVVIKGVVTGQGAIYSGRNTYIAGDLITKNAPDALGEGVCKAYKAGEADSQNLCAQANVANNRDEVRLGARGNTIIGDYTERDSKGNLLSYEKLQSADYYRAQFGLNGEKEFYFDKNTGDELIKKSDGTYKTADNKIVPKGDVKIVKASRNLSPNDDAYSYSMRPGGVSGGNFSSWIDDSYYKNTLLGNQEMTYNTWRTDLPGPTYTLSNKQVTWESETDYKSRIAPSLKAAGLSDSLANTIAAKAYTGKANWEGIKGANPDTTYVRLHERTIRVMVPAKKTYETQVKRIDAFIYSNRRIAGKNSMNPLALNGGMIGKEIGILAPGRVRPTWVPGNDNSYDALNDRSASGTACGTKSGGYSVAGTEDCAFTVNYDYRLRNGGYGYNLVAGDVGQTMTWKLADKSADQVKP